MPQNTSRLVPALIGVIVVLLTALGVMSQEAFAGSVHGPSFSTGHVVTGATFAVPSGSDATWTLKLWSAGKLLGSETGTSGTLSVPVTGSPSCSLQADVQTTRARGKFRYYSGNRATSTCCPAS